MPGWVQISIRAVSLFFLLLITVRLTGKRNLSRATPFNFISFTVIAVITALLVVNVLDITVGLLVLGIWIVLPVMLDYLSIKSKMVHDLVNGKETVLIKHGKIMEENLLQVRLTGEELLRELRAKNAFNLPDVEFAVMETNGDINVLLKSDKKPVTAHDLGRKVAPQAEPQTVILDGNILDEPLSALGLNRGWLNIQLERAGVSLDNVFLGQVDSSGDLYLDLFDDAIQTPQPKVREMLYSILEKSQADLIKYALETKDQQARFMYSNNADRIKQVINKLEPYLLR